MTTKISQLPANQQIAWASTTPAVAVSTPLLNLTQGWSGTATFTLDFGNVTADPGPSNGASLLIDRQYLGASKFKVDRSGSLTLANTITIASTSGYNIGARGGLFAPSDGTLRYNNDANSQSFQIATGANNIAAFNGPVKTLTTTVASLPTGADGMRAFVTDASATTFASTVVGGGANHVPVYYDGGGSAWKIG